MDDTLYREIILEHWKNPQSWGVIDAADIDVSDSNPLCGDKIRITCVIARSDGGATKQSHRLADIKFVCQGCAISKASGSILTELVKEIGIQAFKRLDQTSYLANLQVDLSPARLKCALLPYAALQKGLKISLQDY